MDASSDRDTIDTMPILTTTLTHAPFLNEAIRQQNHAFIPCDSRFAASARFLAHLWRQEHDLPAARRRQGNATTKSAKRPAGWLLRNDAAQAGATFLTPAIRDHARHALLFREPGAMWNEDRLWGHLLSSQALTVNLLAPMAIDLALATRVWKTLLPDFVGSVTRILFEHSPGRFDDQWFGDGTALDALIEVTTPDGEIAVITIEVKFVEGLTGPSARPRSRYVEAARDSGLFKDPDSSTLGRAGFEQLRREHVMTSLMLRHGLASRGCFILIAPQLNRRAQVLSALYQAELVDPYGQNDPATVGFANITLEQVIAAMREAGAGDIALQLWRRYCDHERVARFGLHGDEPPSGGPILPLSPPESSVDATEVVTETIKGAAFSTPSQPSRRRSAPKRARTGQSCSPTGSTRPRRSDRKAAETRRSL